MTRSVFFVTAFGLAASTVGTGCTASPATGEGCASDADCPGALTCDKPTGACLCATDDQCEEGQICNSYGSCQRRPPCLGNHDCDPDEICNSSDPSGGACIPRPTDGVGAACGDGAHCDFGQYCELMDGGSTGSCVLGCLSTSDCNLGDVCVEGQCTPSNCEFCPKDPAPDVRYCADGDRCVNGLCVPYTPETTRAGACGRCNELFSEHCNDGLMCLLDRESCSCIDGQCYPDGGTCTTADDCDFCDIDYCAPRCDTVADCPAGFTAGCEAWRAVGGPCRDDGTCDSGAPCWRDSESDIGYCLLNASTCENEINQDRVCQNGRCMTTCVGDICFNDLDLPCDTDWSCQSTFVERQEGWGVCEGNMKACRKDAGVLCEDFSPGLCHW